MGVLQVRLSKRALSGKSGDSDNLLLPQAPMLEGEDDRIVTKHLRTRSINGVLHVANHMATSRDTSSSIPACVIAAYSDAELNKYLDDHRLADGVAIVDVEDPENLPESFIQRLKLRARHTNNATQPRPIDLDQVTARLLAGNGSSNTSPRPALRGRGSISSSTPPRVPAEVPGKDAYNKLRHLSPPFTRGSSEETLPPVATEVDERDDYNDLVNDGGRPLYPMHLIDKVVGNPLPYWDLLRPWVDYPDCPPEAEDCPDENRSVFGNQHRHWLGFRQWQAHNRREGRPRYLETSSGSSDADLYDHFVWYFRRGSANYTEAATKLLSEYGFARPFQLHDDPKQQDALTTWIEYLSYACAVHYRYTRLVEKYQPDYDTAWKTLVESKILRPSETKDNICGFEYGAQRDREKAMALKAVKSAEAALEVAQRRRGGSRLTTQARAAQDVPTAQARLDAAKSALELLHRRSHHFRNFSHATRNYRIAKTDTAKSNVKLQWILEQIPAVQVEQQEREAAQPGSHAGRSTKRKRNNRDDGVTNVGPSKRPRKTTNGDLVTTADKESSTRSYARLPATAPARVLAVHHGPDRPKRAPEASAESVIKGTRSSRRLAGQAPEFGLNGKPARDAKPPVFRGLGRPG